MLRDECNTDFNDGMNFDAFYPTRGIQSSGANGKSIPGSALELVCDIHLITYDNLMNIQMKTGIL